MPGINPQAGAAQIAGGGPPAGGIPPQPGGQQPPGQAGVGAGGTDINQIMESLKQIIPQVVDERGYVNMDRLITMWPQVSQVPFQTVMQLIQQSPEILNQLITQFGLSGIIVQGRVISAEELASAGGTGGI